MIGLVVAVPAGRERFFGALAGTTPCKPGNSLIPNAHVKSKGQFPNQFREPGVSGLLTRQSNALFPT